jgi:AcrR family transcriptional regulator
MMSTYMVNRKAAPTPEGRQVDTEGSQALTMRRLGQALDRKVMTLYRYVPSKDALLDGVVARVLTDLAITRCR